MRCSFVAPLVALMVGGIFGQAETRAGESSWAGKEIIMKQRGSKIGYTDDNGNQVTLAKLTGISYDALDDKDGWVKVRVGKHEGWFDKNEAVLAEDANAYFTQLLRSNPSNDQYYARRGWAWNVLGEYDKAIADYTQAIRLRPNESDWYGNRGIINRNKKDYAAAIRDYTSAIQIDPSASRYHNRGWTYSMNKEYDKAIADCNQALRLEPDNYFAYNRRGIALTGRGDYEQALHDFDQTLRLNPDHYYVYGNRAKVWLLRNEPEKAVREFELSIKASPKNAEVYNAFAWFLATSYDKRVRDGKRAVELAKKACELSQQRDMAHLATLAAAHAEAGQFDEAVRLQEKALDNAIYARTRGKEARERLKLFQANQAYVAESETAKIPATAANVESVKTPADMITSGPLKGWREFQAPGNAFRIGFPGSPKTHKQRIASPVGNIENHAYSHEGAEMTYLASYFDLPGDGILTLDTAATSYAAGRKGKITSQKTIKTNGASAREIQVQLPDGNVSRARLLTIDGRWYQIIAEGPSRLINSEQTTSFLDSFKLKR